MLFLFLINFICGMCFACAKSSRFNHHFNRIIFMFEYSVMVLIMAISFAFFLPFVICVHIYMHGVFKHVSTFQWFVSFCKPFGWCKNMSRLSDRIFHFRFVFSSFAQRLLLSVLLPLRLVLLFYSKQSAKKTKMISAATFYTCPWNRRIKPQIIIISLQRVWM